MEDPGGLEDWEVSWRFTACTPAHLPFCLPPPSHSFDFHLLCLIHALPSLLFFTIHFSLFVSCASLSPLLSPFPLSLSPSSPVCMVPPPISCLPLVFLASLILISHHLPACHLWKWRCTLSSLFLVYKKNMLHALFLSLLSPQGLHSLT